MRLADVIGRLASECPAFAVTHALRSSVELPRPLLLVAPAARSATPNELLGAHHQRIRIGFSVWIVLDRGSADSTPDDWDDAIAAVRAALVGWTSGPDFAALDYAGGAPDRFAGEVVSWREDFFTETHVRSV